jgi:uroporphyrinogen-III synthase
LAVPKFELDVACRHRREYLTPPPLLTMSPLPIIFLKTKSSPTDPYDKYFAENPLEIAGTTYNAENIFVPVLQHQHINLSQLEKLVLGQNSEYHGMIITSQRAVEALGAVLDKHRGAL